MDLFSDATFFSQIVVFLILIPFILMPFALFFWIVKKLWSR